jgi:hypothetical protein
MPAYSHRHGLKGYTKDPGSSKLYRPFQGQAIAGASAVMAVHWPLRNGSSETFCRLRGRLVRMCRGGVGSGVALPTRDLGAFSGRR